MLHSALDRAVKERLLIRNPAGSYVVPKVQHQEMKTLRPEDLKAYLDAAERPNALAMFYLELVSWQGQRQRIPSGRSPSHRRR